MTIIKANIKRIHALITSIMHDLLLIRCRKRFDATTYKTS